ncbi:MAG: hypothetical protein N2444_01390, partial [Methylocystis sp.]|nr:hypothetical protein [Methylocystis sp.]
MACDTEFETAAIEAQAAIARAGRKQSGLDVSRRSVIGGATTLFTSAFLPNGAHAATDPDARLLVVILRGGMDGMNVVVPKLDPLYPSLRRELAIPASSTLSLGADFGLHPALANLHAMFTAGDAAFIPAAGLPLRNRSHFECQDNLENGLPANTPNATGWLNRLLGALPAGDPIRVRRGIGIGPAPLILRGPEPVFGWSPTWFQKITPANLERLRQLYVGTDPMLWNTLAQGVIADSQASNAGAGGNSGLSVMRQCFIGAGVLMRTAGGP